MTRLLAICVVLAIAGALVYLWRGPARDGERAPASRSADVAREEVAPAPSPVAAAASHDAGGRAAAAASAVTAVTVVKGGWGAGPAQFGRKRDPESNPEAPMAIAVGAGGEVAVLDQVNRRVSRWSGGRLVGTLPFGGDTVQDLALGPGGQTVLLDRLADRNVQVWGDDGKLVNEIPLVGRGVREGGGVTGVFADDKGIYVEREHGALVRVADARGAADGAREELPGRPTRDGRLLVTAAIRDRGAGEIVVRAFDRGTLKLAFEQRVLVGGPVLALVMLDSDRRGAIYVAADTGHEASEPPFGILDEAIVVARLAPGGAPRGSISLPAPDTADETFRRMSVDDDGNIYLMTPGSEGFAVQRFSFP